MAESVRDECTTADCVNEATASCEIFSQAEVTAFRYCAGCAGILEKSGLPTRWDRASTLDSLLSALQGEVERLRDEAATCRDEAARRSHKVMADVALYEGVAIDYRADRLQKLLDTYGGGEQ